VAYDTPLGEEVVQESAGSTGQFYKSNDPTNAYYKVFDSTSGQYVWQKTDDFLRSLYSNPNAVKTIKQQLGYDVIDSSINPDFLKDVEKVQGTLSSTNQRLEKIGESGWSLFSYLQQSKTGKSGVTSTATVTDKNRAAQELLDTAKDYLGSGIALNKADIKSYVSELNALERKRPTVSRTGETVAGGLTADEKEQLALKYIGKYVTAEGIKNVGGALGSNYRTINALAGNYGVQLDKAALRTLVFDSVSSKNGLENVQTKINNLAKVKYKALTPYLDQGLTVKDIANEYVAKKAQLLELNPTAIRIDSDPDIQGALTGDALVPLYQFEKSLRKNSQWQYTNNAREEASNYALTILQDFGLM
jgi:hypothetical protein